MKGMIVRYTCDRCCRHQEGSQDRRGESANPAGWGRMKLEHEEFKDLCVECFVSLKKWMMPTEDRGL